MVALKSCTTFQVLSSFLGVVAKEAVQLLVEEAIPIIDISPVLIIIVGTPSGEVLLLLQDLVHCLSKAVLCLFRRLEAKTCKLQTFTVLFNLFLLSLVGLLVELHMLQTLLMCTQQRVLVEDIPAKCIRISFLLFCFTLLGILTCVCKVLLAIWEV